MNWRGVSGTNIEVTDDGSQFRWVFDYDGAMFLANELHGDGTGREMNMALDVADELRRISKDEERFGISIVMVDRHPVERGS